MVQSRSQHELWVVIDDDTTVQSRLMHRLWKVADFGVEIVEEDLDDAPSTKVSGKSGRIGLQGVAEVVVNSAVMSLGIT